MMLRIERLAGVFGFFLLAGASFAAPQEEWHNHQISPSDLVAAERLSSRSPQPILAATPAAPKPDEPWMRGLDSVTGTEDVVGSGRLPDPIVQKYFSEPIDEPPFVHPPHCPCCINETPISRFRNGFYQGTSISGGYLSDGGDDALSIGHYDLSVRFGIPLDGLENVLVIAPSFRHEMLDGPGGLDLPENLYVTGVNFTWMKTITSRLRSLAMVTPSVRSDFETSNDAVRIFGLGLLTYALIPKTLDASVGVVYLDRDDIPILPAAGITWRPRPWWLFDLNFPRPRIAYRTMKDGGLSENWVYSGLALGGNTWAVRRANGDDDVLTMRDFQWVFGWEHLRQGGRGLFAETGFAFGRALEYERGGEEVDFDNAIFVRLGMNL